MSLLHTFQSQNWQIRDSGCYCLFFVSGLHPVSIILCSHLNHRTAERNATTLLSWSLCCLAADAIHPSICRPSTADGEAASQSAPRWAGLLPSAGSCMQKENTCWGRLQSPKLIPKGIYFRQPIWFKDALNYSDRCLKGKQEEIRDISGLYTTAEECNRGSKFVCNKTKKKQLPVLEMSHPTKTSQSMVLILAASF